MTMERQTSSAQMETIAVQAEYLADSARTLGAMYGQGNVSQTEIIDQAQILQGAFLAAIRVTAPYV